MSTYPNPAWVADHYLCDKGHVTERFRDPSHDDSDWKGVVVCKTCNSHKTVLIASGQAIKHSVTAVKPLTTPPRLLTDTVDGIHPGEMVGAYIRRVHGGRPPAPGIDGGTYGDVFK